MPEALAYLEVAERALFASNGALAQKIHEKATFLGYHAFESLGGAFCRRRGKLYPRSHGKKISFFVNEAKHEKCAVQVAQLAIAYGSIRNDVLYPMVVAPSGVVRHPKNVLSDAQARRLIGRTSSLLKAIKPLV